MFKNLGQFFEYLNNTSFVYVVLRNWDNLPYDVVCGEHSDLDILVYDFDHFKEIMGDKISVVHELPRVQHRINFENGEYVLCDVRHVGDNYYPIDFEEEILNSREWNDRGFYTPSPMMFRIALAYHAVHHKNRNKYENKLGKVPVSTLLEALKQSRIGWVLPDDPTVGDHNAYYKGGTSLISTGNGKVRKEQIRFSKHDLIANEAKFLKMLDSPHFPKLLEVTEKFLDIEDCGESLTVNNLPINWKDQLIEIVTILDQKGIVHRDIRLDNLMVKNGTIMLIDFGWATFKDSPPDNPPDLLGHPNKHPEGFNDVYSMKKIIRCLDAELEELHENTVS